MLKITVKEIKKISYINEGNDIKRLQVIFNNELSFNESEDNLKQVNKDKEMSN
jgi:hypothetical protein